MMQMRMWSKGTSLALAVVLAGCARQPEITVAPETQVQISPGAAGKVTVTDSDGIRKIVGLQRIPVGAEYREENVDFKFDQPGAVIYEVQVGQIFATPGTVLHVEITDMKGQESLHFIRSTPQGYQTGTFTKNPAS